MINQAAATTGTRTSNTRSRLLSHLLLAAAIILYLVNIIPSVQWMLILYQTGHTGLQCRAYYCEIIPDGVQNYTVVPNSPAYRAGIEEGGMLIAVDGQPINLQTFNQFQDAYGNFDNTGEVGTATTVTIAGSEGKTTDYSITRELGWNISWLNVMQALGISNQLATLLMLVPILLTHIVCLVAAGVMYLRGRKHWFPIFLAALMILLPIFTTLYIAPSSLGILISTITDALFGFIGCTALFLLPDGKWVPRWGWIIAAFAAVAFLISSYNLGNALFLVGVVAQIYRYRIAAPEVRQAQKWIAFGLTVSIVPRVALAIMQFSIYLEIANIPTGLLIATVAVYTLSTIGLTLIPITFTFAVMHYRLWDVDLVINRSVVGVAVTVTLIVIFLGVLVALQSILQTVLGVEQTAVAATISTALVLLLFNPTHHRIRHLIDRHVYGFRFDLHALKQQLAPITNPGSLSGKTLGGFHVRNLVGKGGMGEVYQAHADGKTIALKIVSVEVARNPLYRQRIEREAEALAALDHPNIVRFYGAGEFENIFFIALEFVQGQDLKALLSEQGKFSWSDVSARVEEIASALDHAHQRGLVHRDIKPANIMLRRKAEVDTTEAVLTDFGIVKILNADTQITATGNVFGTIDYMAPEQILNSKEVDHRADIYALGIMLYELLTGERPFKGSQGQVLFAHLQQPAPNPRGSNADIPAHVAQSILKALEKQPENRYPSVAVFAAALLATEVSYEKYTA
jgi:hypothetical protein